MWVVDSSRDLQVVNVRWRWVIVGSLGNGRRNASNWPCNKAGNVTLVLCIIQVFRKNLIMIHFFFFLSESLESNSFLVLKSLDHAQFILIFLVYG